MSGQRPATRLVAAFAIILVAVAVYLLRPAGSPDGGNADGGPGAGNDLPRLVDLGADKCVPCKMMAPILEELKETYSAEGEELFRHEGFFSREDILAKWRELGVALPGKDA